MKKYGLRIGSTGVEFSDRESREKAMLSFTKGSCIDISDSSGMRYKDSRGAFSTYERETEEQTMNCSKCEGSFSSEVCTQRTVPDANYSGKFTEESLNGATETKYLCDGCYAKIIVDFEVFRARKVIENAA